MLGGIDNGKRHKEFIEEIEKARHERLGPAGYLVYPLDSVEQFLSQTYEGTSAGSNMP